MWLAKAETRFHSSQSRKRVYLAKTCPGKAKKPLPRENALTEPNRVPGVKNVARKVSNAFTGGKCTSERPKSLHRAKASLANAKSLYRAKTRSQMRKRFYLAKITFVNEKMRLPSEKAISERKQNENVFSARKRRSKSLKRFYRAKTSLAHAKTRLPSEKCVNQAKTSNANAKTRFPTGNVAQ